ncbi:uncharacterized protein BT62DRAFT_934281 [Guyanagaster necrorhizus]|uniref:Uncharacterized protein n=1 Tax=Guyanagaster necrorhizus TaxID=856835 RepID=A0A9P8AQL3_9AGAR|nr:uncharacterized protein BT62DRAFT_934281 [Guyanagaster necrorhizus MCA 3950]KAG7444110.1 hypothetical protein BT62DRAFT_934281 [Guyanagaster necrorhizus MCA 3950]
MYEQYPLCPIPILDLVICLPFQFYLIRIQLSKSRATSSMLYVPDPNRLLTFCSARRS